MTFTETRLRGAWIIDVDEFPDERGAFIRAWVPGEFAARGLETRIEQCSMAVNRRRGTIRGMHYQRPPHEEVKLVRVTRGRIFDVAVDLRPGSPTFRQWIGVELSAANRRMFYVPRGMAHGYQTLDDDAEVMYFVSAPYVPDLQAGVRWNDPALGITWPLTEPAVINARDAGYPSLA
jgi:dTDP-4-dehydrorhamnose 3,5-epimerase